jgi:hypothetical protein
MIGIYDQAKNSPGLFLEVPIRVPAVADRYNMVDNQEFVRLTVLNPSKVTDELRDIMVRICEGDEAADWMLRNRAVFEAAYTQSMKPKWRRWLGL